MISLEAVTNLHRECIARWHEQAIDDPHDGFLRIVCEQLSYNFRLWHEEDKARSPTASDTEIAQVKRAIDKLNQQRNDWIEKLDDWITEELGRRGVAATADAPQNTETLGSSIDRLSILALRIYHLIEQRDRADASAEHREGVTRKLAIALAQHEDLSRAAQQLAQGRTLRRGVGRALQALEVVAAHPQRGGQLALQRQAGQFAMQGCGAQRGHCKQKHGISIGVVNGMTLMLGGSPFAMDHKASAKSSRILFSFPDSFTVLPCHS